MFLGHTPLVAFTPLLIYVCPVPPPLPASGQPERAPLRTLLSRRCPPGDELLVNAHTTLKELLASDHITARLERSALPPPRVARHPSAKGKSKSLVVSHQADDFD